MFAAASASFVKAACSEDFHPVASLDAADDLAPLQLVVKQRRKWPWQKPKFQPTSFSLSDILTSKISFEAAEFLRGQPPLTQPDQEALWSTQPDQEALLSTQPVENSSFLTQPVADAEGGISTQPANETLLSTQPLVNTPVPTECNVDEPPPVVSATNLESHFEARPVGESAASTPTPEHLLDPRPFDPHPFDSDPSPLTEPSDPRTLEIATTVSDFLAFKHRSNFSVDGRFGLSIMKELVNIKFTADSVIEVDADLGRVDKRQVRLDDVHDALIGRKVDFSHDLVEETKKQEGRRLLCVVLTTATTATADAIIKSRRQNKFHGEATVAIGAGVDSELDLDRNFDGEIKLPRGTTVAFAVAELKIFADGEIKVALLEDDQGGFFDKEEDKHDAGIDLSCVDDLQPLVDADSEFRRSLRSVVLELASRPAQIDVLISLFKHVHFSSSLEGGGSDRQGIGLTGKLKQTIADDPKNWRKFFSSSGLALTKNTTSAEADYLLSMSNFVKNTIFECSWTLLQAMEEMTEDQLLQLRKIDDRMAGPLIFAMQQTLLNQCVEKNEEHAFHLFAKNNRNDEDNSGNLGAGILDVFGVVLVRAGEAGEGGGDAFDSKARDIIRFDPPKPWKRKLELAAALKVTYAIFGGEKRVKSFLGTEEESTVCCML